MTAHAPQVPARPIAPLRLIAAAVLVGLALAGCQRKGTADITGSVPGPVQASPEAWKREVDVWQPRFEANPGDVNAALRYARALRALDQKAQAVAVLQQAAIRSPNNRRTSRRLRQGACGCRALQGGRRGARPGACARAPGLADPSAQGAVADQMGDHARAQSYYEAALKLVPAGRRA